MALAKARLFHGRNPVRYLRSEEILHSRSAQPVSHGAVRELIRDRHSIVWIGGSEPLDHPGIGHLARLFVQSGHFLFLETSAVALRQRIHEFQPSSRLYLVVRFLGSEAVHDRRMGRAGAFRAALEGIRAAQLSGFLICAKVDISPEDVREVLPLCYDLDGLDFDGIIPAAGGSSGANSGWGNLLRLVDSARSMQTSEAHVDERETPQDSQADADREEVAQAR